MKWILVLTLFSYHSFAQQTVTPQNTQASETVGSPPATEPAAPTPVLEKVEEVAEDVEQQVSGTSSYRGLSRGTLLVGVEPLSTWLPLKLTASYTHVFNRKWSLEAEVARGKFGAGLLGFDLASVSELRCSVLARRYIGNSFHWIFGLYKDDLRAKLGNDILDDMSSTRVDDLKVDVIGGTLGFGNRWQWRTGFTLGIDWFRMNLPLIERKTDDGVLKYIDNDSDYDVVKRGMDRVAKIPTFVLMGIYLGYTL